MKQKSSSNTKRDLTKRDKLYSLYESAVKVAKILSWEMDFDLVPNADKFFASKELSDVLGFDRDEDGYVLFSDFVEGAYPDDVGKEGMDKVLQEYQLCMEGKKDYYTVLLKMLNKKNNQIVYIENTAEVIQRYEDGKIRVLAGYNKDVTEVEEMKRSIEKLEAANEAAVEMAKILPWRMDFELVPEGDKFFASKELCDVVGFKRDDDGYVLFSDFLEQAYPDEEGKKTLEHCLHAFQLCTENIQDGYSVMIKFLNPITNKAVYVENSAKVIERFPDNRIKILSGYNKDITDIIEMKESIKELELANDAAVQLAKLLTWRMDFNKYPDGERFYANDAFADKLGFERDEDGFAAIDEFIKYTYPDQEGEESMQKCLAMYQECLDNKRDKYTQVIKYRNPKNGKAIYLENSGQVISRDADGRVLGLSGYNVDITDRVILTQSIADLEEENKQLLTASQNAIKMANIMTWKIDFDVVPDGSKVLSNKLLTSMLGLSRDRDGYFDFAEFIETTYPDLEGKETMARLLQYYEECAENKRNQYSHIVKHQNNVTKKVVYLEHHAKVESRYDNDDMKVIVGYNLNVTERLLAQQENEYLIHYDRMTGLRNRNSFDEYTELLKETYPLSIIVTDIDGLKFINDAFGHLAGDEAIKFVAKCLRNEFERDSELFRIGGDEFSIISKDVDEGQLYVRLNRVKEKVQSLETPINDRISFSFGYDIMKDKNTTFRSSFIEAENFMYRNKLHNRKSRKSKSLQLVMETLNQKTEETKDHCARVKEYAINLMKKIGFNRQKDLEEMALLSEIHDIGKISIPVEILNKPDKLTDEEFAEIRSHSESGYKIVRNIVESDRIAYGVLHHHEKYDGSGYPFNLAKTEIPIFARILCIADSFDAMTTDRVYSRALTTEEAIEELKRCSGTQFDPELVEKFIEIIQ